MSEPYNFENLSPIEFEALCVDLLSEHTGESFERFSPGADGGMDGRHSSAAGDKILQAKHYKNSRWGDLKAAAKREHQNLIALAPSEYHFHTSQPLTPARKAQLISVLDHPAVSTGNIWGQAELNDRLRNHPKVERRHIKLWLSSAAVLEKVVRNDIAIFTEATEDEIARILRVYVENPSLQLAAKVLEKRHNLIISGPPGVGKTTLAQILAAEYCDDGWELIAISEIDDAFAVFRSEEKQVFVFDDFLGKIKLDKGDLAQNEARIFRLIEAVSKRKNKRFILTTRSYVLQAAREISDVLSSEKVDLSEVVLDLSFYTREIKARILYNHLYHSELPEEALRAIISGDFPKRIVDHKSYMPRIVQWMTELSAVEGIEAAEYPEYFLKTLENPNRIWEKAFRKHVSDSARLLLFAMYFSERAMFPNPGVSVGGLKVFFRALIEKAEIGGGQHSTDRLFEETLREIKSSFIVIEGDRANFINPSVLDFLSQEVVDVDILELLALSAERVDEVHRVWRVAHTSFKKGSSNLARISKAVQGRMLGGPLGGRIPFRKAVRLIGEMLLAFDDGALVSYLRGGGLGEQVWVNEPDLIPTIEDLEEREFQALPHAKAYARMLRAQLSAYVIGREYVLELEEIADLMECLSDSFIEFPSRFTDALNEAAGEAVDSLDPFKFGPGEDPETVLGGWLEQIEKIESFSHGCVDRSKKREIEESLQGFEMHQQNMMDEYRERARFRGSPSPTSSRPTGFQDAARSFSDKDLSSLFASLRSPK